jgi:hypothetical protein
MEPAISHPYARFISNLELLDILRLALLTGPETLTGIIICWLAYRFE